MDQLNWYCFGSGFGSGRVLISGVRVSNYPTRPSPNQNSAMDLPRLQTKKISNSMLTDGLVKNEYGPLILASRQFIFI